MISSRSHLHSGHAAFAQPNFGAIQKSVRKGTSSWQDFSYTAIKQTPNFQLTKRLLQQVFKNL